MANVNEILWVVKNVYLGCLPCTVEVGSTLLLVFHNKKKKEQCISMVCERISQRKNVFFMIERMFS